MQDLRTSGPQDLRTSGPDSLCPAASHQSAPCISVASAINASEAAHSARLSICAAPPVHTPMTNHGLRSAGTLQLRITVPKTGLWLGMGSLRSLQPQVCATAWDILGCTRPEKTRFLCQANHLFTLFSSHVPPCVAFNKLFLLHRKLVNLNTSMKDASYLLKLLVVERHGSKSNRWEENSRSPNSGLLSPRQATLRRKLVDFAAVLLWLTSSRYLKTTFGKLAKSCCWRRSLEQGGEYFPCSECNSTSQVWTSPLCTAWSMYYIISIRFTMISYPTLHHIYHYNILILYGVCHWVVIRRNKVANAIGQSKQLRPVPKWASECPVCFQQPQQLQNFLLAPFPQFQVWQTIQRDQDRNQNNQIIAQNKTKQSRHCPGRIAMSCCRLSVIAITRRTAMSKDGASSCGPCYQTDKLR